MKIRVQTYHDEKLKLKIEIHRYLDGRIKLIKGSSESYIWVEENGIYTSMRKNDKFDRLIKQELDPYDACSEIAQKILEEAAGIADRHSQR